MREKERKRERKKERKREREKERERERETKRERNREDQHENCFKLIVKNSLKCIKCRTKKKMLKNKKVLPKYLLLFSNSFGKMDTWEHSSTPSSLFCQ